MKKIFRISLLIFILLGFLPIGQIAYAQELPVVHAVLFYSNTCAHCEKVITEDIPPLIEKYGDQLDIIAIETSTLDAQKLFFSAIQYYELPEGRAGVVPTLIVGNTILIGDVEIPEQFPVLIEEGLANGGIPVPDFPGMAESLGEIDSSPTEKLTMGERFALDPAGNTVSVITLLGMLLVVGMVVVNFKRPVASKRKIPVWLIPTLATIGIGVALYLSYVEMTRTDAVCGPVGDCNAVQGSRYATLFGILPVGVLGVIGYVLIFAAWGVQNYGAASQHPIATKALWYMAGFGTLFSIYLTFLEPFVIGATCMWCITSAIVQTAIFWLATDPAKKYLVQPASKKRRRPAHKAKRRKRR
jgi:uncharacterized membrane protein